MANRCPSVCLVGDDRFGAVPRRCENAANHDGEHYAWLTACAPIARMVWSDEPSESRDDASREVRDPETSRVGPEVSQ